MRRQPDSVAVLIRLPAEHLTRSGGGGANLHPAARPILSGPEALRKRLLESAGFRVVELDYGALSAPGPELRDRLRALCLGDS